MKIKVIQLTARADMGGGPKHVQHLLKAIHNQVECFAGCPEDKPFFDSYKSLLGDEKMTTIPHRKLTLKALFSLLKYVKKNDIHLVHSHGKGASVYGKLLKILKPSLKLIYTPNGIHVDEYSRLAMMLYQTYEYLTCGLFNHIIYVSESEREKAKQSKLFLRNKFSIIPNGVPTFYPPANEDLAALRNSLFKQPERKIILTFSRFDYQKNMQETFDIAASLPEYNFLWLGDGEDYLPLKEKAAQQGIDNINMLGVQHNIDAYLSISDMYLTTSRWEGLPLALLEAMAAGMPILATNVTGNKDLINRDTGDLYELGDISSAVEKIKQMLENPSFNETVIKDYFEKNYSVNNMASGVVKIYKELV